MSSIGTAEIVRIRTAKTTSKSLFDRDKLQRLARVVETEAGLREGFLNSILAAINGLPPT
jgi:hypothetical protein